MNDTPNFGPLPVLDLRNRSDKGQGPLAKGDNRKKLVENLQRMLLHLGYDLSRFGADGDFGDETEKAVQKFQKEHRDWKGYPLKKDGLVGPKTSDAFNRSFVGVLYEEYDTPKELDDENFCIASTSEECRKGIEKDLGSLKKGRLVLVKKEKLVIRLIDTLNQPIKNAKVRVEIGAQKFEGESDQEGIINLALSDKAKTGKIKLIDWWEIKFEIKKLEPASSPKGLKDRLDNLGYYAEDISKDGGLALMRFQSAYDLKTTGKTDEATAKKLEEVHGA